jgi:hypothetical protein
MALRELRFALDEKGLKALAPTLVGKTISYWHENELRRGTVKSADVVRDRYGNPYIEADVEDLSEAPAA